MLRDLCLPWPGMLGFQVTNSSRRGKNSLGIVESSSYRRLMGKSRA